jgi:sugar phosphate isomerase/epimerase
MLRRDFLVSLGTLTAAAACGAHPRPVTSAQPTGVGRVGLQLYTVRGLMEKDVPGTLAQVAAVGYKEVEFAGYFGHSPSDIRALLEKNGLTSPSSHIPYDLLVGDWQKALDDAKTAGHEWATVPWLAPQQRGTTADAWKRLADQLNKGAQMAHATGLRCAYHNHDFEFTPVDGQVPLEILLNGTDPSLVDFEMDVYWVTKAGADPLDLFARHPGRFKLLHLKDATAAPTRAMADVGHGTIDWPAVLAKRPQAGTAHVFVERDDAPDPLASIRASYEYLTSLK